MSNLPSASDATAAADHHGGAVQPTVNSEQPPADSHKASFAALALGSIGVVFGDIGTSPIYALRESLLHVTGGGLQRSEVIGTVSLLLWSLIVVVTLKYVAFIMRADNKGEGGTLSLLALAQHGVGKRTRLVFALGIAGAALFYGDAIITPAISVLSAVEGLELMTPTFKSYVVPITVAILLGLFAVQSRGTHKVGVWFGPITLVWFVVIGLLGLKHIPDDPTILFAFNPYYGVNFLLHEGAIGFAVIGSVFLAVTGAEALYADMGHFGRGPIRFGWLAIVLPCLAVNYIGQGAAVLADPSMIDNLFFKLAPEWAVLPLVILATAATVIASQAVITGAYSMTQQAIQLGLLPRMEIRYTSETTAGQIFVPRVNRLLLIGVLLLVLLFGSSSKLAAAYGISVTGTMVVTTALAFIVSIRVWGWKVWLALAVVVPFLVVDVTFLVANLFKFLDGGYVPLTLALVMMVMMASWVRGTVILTQKMRRDTLPLTSLFRSLDKVKRVPGTAVFLTTDPTTVPHALLHNLKHNKVLHETNVILSVQFAETPRVPKEERTTVEHVSTGFWRVVVNYGYMDTPNVPLALAKCRQSGLKFDIMTTSFFLGRRNLKPDPRSGMPAWQDRLFIALSKDAANATDFFHIPAGRVVELGTQVLV